MTDFLGRLIERGAAPVAMVRPRPAALFEPAVPFGGMPGLAEPDAGGDGAEETAERPPSVAAAIPEPPRIAPAERPEVRSDRTDTGAVRVEPAPRPVVPAVDHDGPRRPEPARVRALTPPAPVMPIAVVAPPVGPPPAAAPSTPAPPAERPAPSRRREEREPDPVAPTVVTREIVRVEGPTPAGSRPAPRDREPAPATELTEIVRRLVLQPVRREEVVERVVERVAGEDGADRRRRAGETVAAERRGGNLPPATVAPVAPRRPAVEARPTALAPRIDPPPPAAEPLTPAATRTVQVRIGRVEVRATVSPAAPPPPERPSPRANVMSLEDYLARGSR